MKGGTQLVIKKQMGIPQDVNKLIEVLNAHGYEAYAVGGCVRDSLLGRIPEDWDIATDAKPEEIKELFAKTIDTGIKHGTVTVLFNQMHYEITTYRIDGEYADNRHPQWVQYTDSLKSDLSRRDFTVNAMAYHPSEGLIDPFLGLQALENRIIKAVGNPDARFQEDALRMLRAIRFSAQLNFEIEALTLSSIKSNNALITHISQERVRDELNKILLSDNPMNWTLLRDTGILQHILPEFDACFETVQSHPYHIYNVAFHTLNAVNYIEKDRVLRWAMLLHDIGKPLVKTTDKHYIDHFYNHQTQSVILAQNVLTRLRFDSRSLEKICRLIKHHDLQIKPELKAVKKAVINVGEDIFLDLLKVMEADKKAQNPQYLQERLDALTQVRKLYTEMKEEKHCLNIRDLAINGDDLLQLGFKPGKSIGQLLERLFKAVIDNPELNNRDDLLRIATKKIKE